MPDESIAISNYKILKRDAVRQGETGLALYVHHSIRDYTSRRADRESQHTDEFITMRDKIYDGSKNNVLVLGDFNIDILKPHSACESTISVSF